MFFSLLFFFFFKKERKTLYGPRKSQGLGRSGDWFRRAERKSTSLANHFFPNSCFNSPTVLLQNSFSTSPVLVQQSLDYYVSPPLVFLIYSLSTLSVLSQIPHKFSFSTATTLPCSWIFPASSTDVNTVFSFRAVAVKQSHRREPQESCTCAWNLTGIFFSPFLYHMFSL